MRDENNKLINPNRIPSQNVIKRVAIATDTAKPCSTPLETSCSTSAASIAPKPPGIMLADNAACEGFFERLKMELFYPRNWHATTIEQFIQVVDSYIRWYNEKRINISHGSLSPFEYRVSLGFTA